MGNDAQNWLRSISSLRWKNGGASAGQEPGDPGKNGSTFRGSVVVFAGKPPVSHLRPEPLILDDQSRWFAEEVLPHEPPLRSYLRQSLPSFADVDDIVQDCFARMLRARRTGTVRSPKPLLFAIARNAVRDFFHRRGRAELIPITENAEFAVLEDEGDVVELVCRRQELALLTDAIASLPERCREVLLLRKIKGMSQKEIAALLGIAEHTVEALAAKGTRRCAEYLQSQGLEARC